MKCNERRQKTMHDGQCQFLTLAICKIQIQALEVGSTVQWAPGPSPLPSLSVIWDLSWPSSIFRHSASSTQAVSPLKKLKYGKSCYSKWQIILMNGSPPLEDQICRSEICLINIYCSCGELGLTTGLLILNMPIGQGMAWFGTTPWHFFDVSKLKNGNLSSHNQPPSLSIVM